MDYLLESKGLLYDFTFNFVIGLVFSPFSLGYQQFIMWVLGFQIITVIVTKRIVIDCIVISLIASYLGFVFGRTLVNLDIINL